MSDELKPTATLNLGIPDGFVSTNDPEEIDAILEGMFAGECHHWNIGATTIYFDPWYFGARIVVAYRKGDTLYYNADRVKELENA